MDGYPAESHYIVTSDGYILNVHRIPSGIKRTYNGKVAFLVPGLTSTSEQWVLTRPGKSLGKWIQMIYSFSDHCYNVMYLTNSTKYANDI